MARFGMAAYLQKPEDEYEYDGSFEGCVSRHLVPGYDRTVPSGQRPSQMILIFAPITYKSYRSYKSYSYR
jgi:hypothetical protein